GDYIYGYDNDSLPDAVLNLAAEQGEAVAVCEQGTGATVTSALAAHLSDDNPFRGGTDIEGIGVALLTQDVEISPVALIPGTVENARLLASTARRLYGASYGLGVSADITQGSERYGTVVCAVDAAGVVTDLARGYRTLPPDIRRRAALWAVEYLRLALLGR